MAAKTLRNVKENGFGRTGFLMQGARLQALDKAIKSAYGLIFTYEQLLKLDETCIKGIDKMLK